MTEEVEMTEEIRIQKETQIQAPSRLIRDTILDTENYPSFLDSIRKSYVHESEEGFSDVLFHAKVLMFPIQFRMHTQLEDESVIHFHQISGYFEKLEGTWTLEDEGKLTNLKFDATFKMPPGAIPTLIKACKDHFFPEIIDFFQNEIQKRIRASA
ncbi:MAG: SRPBCC family protein [Bdellovibrionota bacterium]|nr:SRPBCC family protein [Bdellovibrionota bacterium]